MVVEWPRNKVDASSLGPRVLLEMKDVIIKLLVVYRKDAKYINLAEYDTIIGIYLAFQ